MNDQNDVRLPLPTLHCFSVDDYHPMGTARPLSADDRVELIEGMTVAMSAVLKPRPDYYGHALPSPDDAPLLVEVADTSLGTDRQVKGPLYASHGVDKS